MLEFYFKSPGRLEQMRSGPLAEHIGYLAAKLYRRGFTRATGQRILSLTGRFNGFAAAAGVEEGHTSRCHNRHVSPTRRSLAEIARTDMLVGRLLDGLAVQGRLEDTLVVVLGDHGEALGHTRRRTTASSSTRKRCRSRS